MVTAAEKYAELNAAGLERDVCDCHGEVMSWNGDTGRPNGGRWRCPVRNRERYASWIEANKDRRRSTRRKYYEANRERLLVYAVAYNATHQDRKSELAAERYAALTGFEYNRLLFRGRRNKALLRIEKRHQARATNHEGATSG